MKLPQVSVEQVLRGLQSLPSDWLNSVGKKTLSTIDEFVKSADPGVNEKRLGQLLSRDPFMLDVIRLFLGLSQDEIASALGARTGIRGTYSAIRRRLKVEKDLTAVINALIAMDAIEEINSQIGKTWTISDVLAERYKYQRGRAIKGQRRGRSLEDEIEAFLKDLGVSYVRGGSFTGRDGKTAKADFSIPSLENPKIVIESKAFQATGSKLTDFLGDVLRSPRQRPTICISS